MKEKSNLLGAEMSLAFLFTFHNCNYQINAYKNEHGDPPESMQILYNYLHKRHIDKTAKVKAMVGSYK